MTPGARLSAVIHLYDEVRALDRPADQIMHAFFRQRKFIGSKDRRSIADQLYLLFRHDARLRWWAAKTGMKNDGRGLLQLWLGIAEGRDIAEVDELFDGTGYGPDRLSRFEYDLLKKWQGTDFIPKEMDQATRAECPEWAYKSLQKAFGTDFDHEMDAMQDEASLDVRINSLKDERASVLKKLQHDGMQAVPTPYSPLGIRIQGRPAFSVHPLFDKGHVEVQDEGSQLLSLLCGAKPGDWVVDFCAGAGGKTLALAAEMQNKGRIWACDIDGTRLENSRKRLRKAGVHCAELHKLSSETDDWVRKHKGKADIVLIDAPCSGVGTWRRNPFVRWQKMGLSLKQLLEVQGRILDSASRLVKPGGRLIYATCSMLPEENQQQVDRFLAEHAVFKSLDLATASGKMIEGLDLSTPSLQFTPARYQTDGFFISAMKRD